MYLEMFAIDKYKVEGLPEEWMVHQNIPDFATCHESRLPATSGASSQLGLCLVLRL